MSNAPANDASSAEDLPIETHLSAWMDGEAPDPSHPPTDLVDRWRDDASVRARWALYHQIGDTLRTPELAGSDDDARFLAAFRERLGAEPMGMMVSEAESAKVVPLAAWRRTRDAARRWTVPVGIAAGVAMVSSALWFTPSGRQDSAVQVSSLNVPATGVLVAASAAIPLGRSRAVINGFAPAATGDAIQAVDFEPYLSAHKQFQTSTAPGPATGFLRSAVYESR